ncbi:hypothetical protein ACFONA_16850, partial [Sphingomonas hylomeconis]
PAARPVPQAASVATAPVAAAPAPVPAAAVAPPVPAPVESAAPAEPAATTESATTREAAPVWPWIVGGLVVLGALLAFLLRRRSRVDADDEDDYDADEAQVAYAESQPEPVPAPLMQPEPAPADVAPVAPVFRQTQGAGRLQPQFLKPVPAAAPVLAAAGEGVAVEAALVAPEAAEVDALTAGSAHADRPWLEFAFRPVRAGSNAEDALVEIELTVGNSGGRVAEDVRISTLLLADGSASQAEIDQRLADHARGEVAPVTIAPGEGARVDATLSLPKAQLGGDARIFNPVVVADARYHLADGSEGRTSAAFVIGHAGAEEGLRGITLHRQQMSGDIEARLHGVPQHA